MNKQDISFFEELQGVLANKRIPKKHQPKAEKAVGLLKAKQEKQPKKPRALLNFLTLQPVVNPCNGCPFERKPKLLEGVGDLNVAKLLVVIEKATDSDILNRTLSKNGKYQKFLPLFKQVGFTEQDLYFTSLTRCSGMENLDAVAHCSNYLRQELSRDNIKGTLILGLRPFQLLIDKDRTTVFKARGTVFELLQKPCMVTFAEVE